TRDKKSRHGLDLHPGSGFEHGCMEASTNPMAQTGGRSAVIARGLRKAYGDKVVLDDVDLNIGEGEVFALLGPNGAGKTTTVKILSTLIPADAGTASVRGHELPAHARAGRASGGGAG